MQWNPKDSADSLEPLSWPIRIASVVVLPVCSILILSFPLSLAYSFQYMKYSETAPGVIMSAHEDNSGQCVSEIRFEVDGQFYNSFGDCIKKEMGEEVQVKYVPGEDGAPIKSTSKSAWFALGLVPLVGIFLTLFGLWSLVNCFYFYRQFLLGQIQKELDAAAEKKASRDPSGEYDDLLEEDYDEETWYSDDEETDQEEPKRP